MRFKPFNEKKIGKEFADLPVGASAHLIRAMKALEDGEEKGWKTKDYGDGIQMITDSGSGQGRCLFFESEPGTAVILLVYKKESQKVPLRILKTAATRKKQYEEE